MPEDNFIRIRGAREHNLKNVNLDIPRNALTVVTGLSGSGKSSLAFDTIYVEGQRRYVESLSAYARQFLETAGKPEVESITGLPPTIAIEQRRGHANPRSTVATTTEIYDYLRLLFARAGTPHCWICGKPITRQTPQQIVDSVMAEAMGKRVAILSPLVRGRKGEHRDVIARLKREGFLRARIDGLTQEIRELSEIPEKRRKHTLEAVIDRLQVGNDSAGRLAEAVETALRLAKGLVAVSLETSRDAWRDLMYSEDFGCPDCNVSFQELEPRMFSFNTPYGACPTCDGLGTRLDLDADLVIPDPSLSLKDGALEICRKGSMFLAMQYQGEIDYFARRYRANVRQPFNAMTKRQRDIFLWGDPDSRKPRAREAGPVDGPGFAGVIPMLEEQFRRTDSDLVKQKIHDYMAESPCPDCGGARLKPAALAVKVGGVGINQVTAMSTREASRFLAGLKLAGEGMAVVEPVRAEALKRLSFMSDVGLDYLTLDRMTGTLSGGEHQRIRLASQVGSGLVGVCYVLDEPTIGLHQRDNRKLLGTLLKMRDLGNSVLVVEHDEDVIRAADFLVDMGPGAGRKGGELVAAGTVAEVAANPASPTGAYLSGREAIALPARRRRADPEGDAIRLIGASGNNLRRVEAAFPLGCLICVTGVSGSGKSTLVTQTLCRALRRHLHNSREKPAPHAEIRGLDKVDKVVEIDQSPIGKTPRSNPATYTGVFDGIRRLFTQTREAKMRGYQPGRFSFNVKGGRCEHCQGAGLIKIEMHFLPDVFVQCEQCGGSRYNRETLEIAYRGKNIAEVLALPIAEALPFFGNIPPLREGLTTLEEVGLGYVTLGQSSTTLSGGEAQRVKLATELSRRATGKTVYILDEPTTGLHFADIRRLLAVLNRLVDLGNTVIVIEHNLDMVKSADWLIDLGPEGGDNGGRLVAAGTPEQVAGNPASFTGRYLRRVLGMGEAAAGC
ncbi:MAG: excinuclease ABC subunit UvrA [Planctomycetota bacterium]|jgi:excinuclease ABC subunit A|nr:excinuclease ABC subunit UvrA [Planctomycetota bacterium]